MTTLVRSTKYRIRLRSDIQAERVFLRYQRVAFSAAKRIATKCNRPISEMSEEALAKLGEMASDWNNAYDPDRGSSPCTWIYTKVYYHLLSICVAKQRHREVDLPPTNDIKAKDSWLEQFKRELGEEANALIRIIIEAPSETFRGVMGKDTARARILVMNHLREWGWDEDKIDTVWTEVQLCLESV